MIWSAILCLVLHIGPAIADTNEVHFDRLVVAAQTDTAMQTQLGLAKRAAGEVRIDSATAILLLRAGVSPAIVSIASKNLHPTPEDMEAAFRPGPAWQVKPRQVATPEPGAEVSVGPSQFRGPTYDDGHQIWTYDDGQIFVAALVTIEKTFATVAFTAENIGETEATLFPDAFGLGIPTTAGRREVRRLEAREVASRIRLRTLPFTILGSVAVAFEDDGLRYLAMREDHLAWKERVSRSIQSVDSSAYRTTTLAPGDIVSGFIFFDYRLRPGERATLLFNGLRGVATAETRARQ